MTVPQGISGGQALPETGVSSREATGPPGRNPWNTDPWGRSDAQIRRHARGGAPSKHRKCLMRRIVFARDGYTCRQCGWQPTLPPPPGWDGTWTLYGPDPIQAQAPGWHRGVGFLPDYYVPQKRRLLTLDGEPWTPVPVTMYGEPRA